MVEKISDEFLQRLTDGSGVEFVEGGTDAFSDDAFVDDPEVEIHKRAVDAQAHEAAMSHLNEKPEPTDSQKSVGNYPKGHINVGGLEISIENPAGTRRRPEWETLKAHYGYIKLTTGADGEQIDVFVKIGTDDAWSGPVYVIDQVKPDGKFDEHKVMVGFESRQKAVATYLASYQAGWKLGAVTRWSWKKFTQWVKEQNHTEPIA